MTAIITLLCLILLVIVIIQIGKVSELAGRIRGEADVQRESNYWNSRLGMVFMVLFLVGTIVTAYMYKNYMLGYGPHESASAHGGVLDQMFDITLLITGVVFIITQIALFYFPYKYRQRPGNKADFMPHDNKLEVVWTAIPAVAMTVLVVFGLNAWNEVMTDVSPDEEYLQIEATGMQFAWIMRYPGPDAHLGNRNFREISLLNPLGVMWEDENSWDDFQPSEIVLPVGKKVRVKITARDVLHNFDLPHFRVKMDAVPGMPTYFIFTPTTTTEEYRERLSKYSEYQKPSDPDDPESPMLWETFEYELACAELCGNGHFSMKMLVKIVEEDEYEQWLQKQNSYYMSNVRGSNEDPFIDMLIQPDHDLRRIEFADWFEQATASEEVEDDVIVLDYLFFKTASAVLDDHSEHELDNIVAALKNNPGVSAEIFGYTDNTGEPEYNLELSRLRAETAAQYLIDKGISAERLTAIGMGQELPIDTNDTEEGREANRRTELRLIFQ